MLAVFVLDLASRRLLLAECNRVGDEFSNRIQELAASVPYIYGIGNHETDIAVRLRQLLSFAEADFLTSLFHFASILSRWCCGQQYTYHTFLSRVTPGQLILSINSSSDTIRWFSVDLGLVHFGECVRHEPQPALGT